MTYDSMSLPEGARTTPPRPQKQEAHLHFTNTNPHPLGNALHHDFAQSETDVSIHSSSPLTSHAAFHNIPIPPEPSTEHQAHFLPKSRTSSRPGTRANSPSPNGGQFNEKRWNKIPPLSRESTAPYYAPNNTKHPNHPYGHVHSLSNSDLNPLFAEGDMPNGRVTSLWLRLISGNLVVRWALFIIPITALLWIPGIVGVTSAPHAAIWSVKLLYWSIYLTVLYVGWFGSVAAARLGPKILLFTVGIVAPESKHYIAYLSNTTRYVGIFLWTMANWICFNQIINKNSGSDKTQGDGRVTSQLTQAWFGIFLSSAILLGEKLVIQVIARSFHKRSYEDRISENKFQIRSLTTLYVNSRDIGRSDTLDGGVRSPNASKVFKSALKHVKRAAQTGATALGTVASEFAGERVMQPNSPQAMVIEALQSQNKSRQLARRIFFTFVPHYRQDLRVEDILRYFPSREIADQAFTFFDKDDNGDATLDEVEMAVVECHRERKALASSMRDLDSAVGRLDAILMSVFYLVAILLIVGLLDVSFNTLIASAGTVVLGLSWLIGTTAQEILLSIIFLFVKHPYDVGDRVRLDTDDYVVKEMHLLSTVFRRLDGCIVQMPHTLINTKPLVNIRRSGPISEQFCFNIEYGTALEKIQLLRDKMLLFLEKERRDFYPVFDIVVQDIQDQGKISLSVMLKYKSNWQNAALQAQRHNKFVCALKLSLAQLEIWGPDGAGNPSPDPPDPTLIKMLPHEPSPPYKSEYQSQATESTMVEPIPQDDQHNFTSLNDIIDDAAGPIFHGPNGRNPDEEILLSNGMSGTSPSQTIRDQYLGGQTPTASTMRISPRQRQQPDETIEMHRV